MYSIPVAAPLSLPATPFTPFPPPSLLLLQLVKRVPDDNGDAVEGGGDRGSVFNRALPKRLTYVARDDTGPDLPEVLGVDLPTVLISQDVAL